jgi:hypothetical protein
MKPARRVGTTRDSDDEDSMPDNGDETVAIITPSKTEVYYDKNDVEHSEVNEEESVSAKANQAGQSIKELITTTAKKAKKVVKHKTKPYVARVTDPSSIIAEKDARDIGYLGDKVNGVTQVFEETMAEIRTKSYSEQARMLNGYVKLLQEQINVIDSRIDWSKRLGNS